MSPNNQPKGAGAQPGVAIVKGQRRAGVGDRVCVEGTIAEVAEDGRVLKVNLETGADGAITTCECSADCCERR